MTPQVWVRPLDKPSGHWKKQLPGKHLKLAARGDIDGLHSLLTANPSFLNHPANHGRTLLWEATRAGKLEVVQFLLDMGADVTLRGCYNSEAHVQLPPVCAAQYYKRSAVNALLSQYPCPMDFFRLAFLGDLPALRKMYRKTPALVDATDDDDEIYFMPAIAFAVVGGDDAVTKWLCSKMASIAHFSATLAFLCGLADRFSTFDLLLEQGLEADAIDASAFVSARSTEFCARLIAAGIDINKKGDGGFSPLLYCCRGDKGKKQDRIKLLLEAGADLSSRDPQGKTVLHLAAKSPVLVQLLLEYGADPDLKDHQGVPASQLIG
jgi:ankyrin repeat protein